MAMNISQLGHDTCAYENLMLILYQHLRNLVLMEYPDGHKDKIFQFYDTNK
jgi:hypothetical protein